MSRPEVPAQQGAALDLARAAGVEVPEAHLIKVGGRNALIVDRFDRVGVHRVGYASALMLEARDGDLRSYVDLAAVIEQRSASATAELTQLWRRVAFSVLISNTDDHLRNHGFLHQYGDVWKLSPAFDLNPNPDPGLKYLATAIDDVDTAARIDTLLDVAAMFRLGPGDAPRVLAEVTSACARWEPVAQGNGLARMELDTMAPAFEHEQAQQDAPSPPPDATDHRTVPPCPARRGGAAGGCGSG